MIPLAALRAMVAGGASAQAILEYAEKLHADRAPQRSKAAARTKRWRDGVRRVTTHTDASPKLNTRAAAAPPDDNRHPDFDQFWAAYPTKVARRAAFKAFTAAKRTGVTFAALMFGLERYKAEKPPDIAWCHPATWLNGGRWDDQPAKRTRNGNGNSAVGNAFDDLIARAEGAGCAAGDRATDITVIRPESR